MDLLSKLKKVNAKSDKKTNGKGKKKKKKNIIQEYVEAFGVAIIAALIIRALVIQAFRIPTGSMENTLLVGDFLLVNKFIYGAKIPFTDIRLPAFDEPKPNDIVVFKYPKDPKLDYIKRCLAVGGQTVEIRNKVVYVDGKEIPLPPKGQHIFSDIRPPGVQDYDNFPTGSGNRDNYGPVKVPENHYFMLGDNRDNSQDSRYWGFLPKENIVGKPLIIYFSWDKTIPLYRFFKKIRWVRIGDLIR